MRGTIGAPVLKYSIPQREEGTIRSDSVYMENEPYRTATGTLLVENMAADALDALFLPRPPRLDVGGVIKQGAF